ncbi:MAG: class IV adenylate cyclase [Ignavibacteriaceae bacterium]
MPTNLELKVKLTSFNQVEKLLKGINAELTAKLNQKDVYYKTVSGLLKLRIENGKQSIIKYLRDEKSKNRFSNFEVLHFSDGDAEKFFGELFKTEAVVEKKRILYMFNNTRVHLDHVKNLGYFLELETLVLFGKSDAKKRFDEIVKLLQLDKYQQIKRSYRDLILGIKNKQ